MKLGRDTLFITSIVLIAAITILALFFPNVIDYEYSYVKLNEKKEEIEDNNTRLLQKEIEISRSIEDLSILEKEKDEIFKEATDLKKEIRKEDFELDMPSFLIVMEEKAKEMNVTLDIDYKQVKTIHNSVSPDTSENEEHEEDADGEPQEETSEDNSNVTIDDKDDSESLSEEQVEEGTMEIDGIDVTVVPIEIVGGYSNVRSFIKYLDEVGMIEPSSATLTSKEKEVTSKIVLNIFHGEVF